MVEASDLLDLDWESTAANKVGQTPSTNTAQAPAATSIAGAVTVSADKNVKSTAGDTAVEDDWNGFQSATPQQSPPIAAAPQVQTGAPCNGVQATPDPGTESSALTVVGAFDPLVCPQKDKSGVPDVLSSTDLEILDPKPGKGSDNLISFGALDEFDPVAQKWATEQHVSADDQNKTGGQIGPGELVQAPVAPAPQAAQTAPATAPAVPQTSTGGGQSDLLGLGTGPVESRDVATVAEPLGADLGCDIEDISKKMIYVFHKGEKNMVGWYADMAPADIKEAVLCACDAIIDGGFVLREVQFTGDDETSAEPKEDGKVFEFEQFDQLENMQTYIIEAAQERDDLKKYTGDRWRRLKIQVEPLLHVEAQKAIERMRRGSNLLRHTHYGFPHLRQFQLSDDRKRLVWYSGAKRKEDSVVQLDEVVEIRLGQTTPVFLHYRLPMLEHLSFSLVYGPKGSKSQKTLDLTCKDEFEFDHWVTGLKAIFYHFKNRQISKEQLLGHSKRFRKALEKNNVGIKLTKLPEVKEKGHVGLDDCIEIVTHTPQQLDTKMERLRERLRTMSQQVARLDHHSAAEMEVDLSLLTGQGPAYASVFVQDEDAQDEEMEIRRMHELVEQTTQILQQARNELIALNQRQKSESSGSGAEANAKGKKKESAACKHIDQLLWKAEVDLENVEDMYLRHIDNQRETATPFSVSLAEVNSRIWRATSDVEEALTKKVEEVRSWFG